MLTRSIAWLCVATFLTAAPAAAQFVQQGPRLEPLSANGTGTLPLACCFGSYVSMSADGSVVVSTATLLDVEGDPTAIYVWSRRGPHWQLQTRLLAPSGYSIAISGDGNTIMLGLPGDGNREAALVWRRSGGSWIQDGSKILRAAAEKGAGLGWAVALSHDGLTAIVAAPRESAAYIWSRQADVWTQTAKLLPDNRIGSGLSENVSVGNGIVSLSADGNTALMGLTNDNNGAGAAWIWERIDGRWRQGPKLVASTAINAAWQGGAVALSADGQTAIVGGGRDNDFTGAAWIWAKAGAGWSEVAKLVSPERSGGGGSVSLSGDGRVALVGGYSGFMGSDGPVMWIKSGNSWPLQGSPLVGSNDGGIYFWRPVEPGLAVALSADGTTAAFTDTGPEGLWGAMWIFSAPPTTLPGADMDGDGVADVAVWQPHTGRWQWQTAASGFDPARAGSTSWGRADYGDRPMTGDVDGDGIDDLIAYRATTGVWNWLTSSTVFTRSGSTQWGVPALGDRPMLADLDGDHRDDFIVWRPGTGVWHWLKSTTGYDPTKAGSLAWGSGSLDDRPLTGDFDGDGRADVAVWRPTDNTFYWFNSSTLTGGAKTWGVAAVGDIPLIADIDGDHRADLAVWRPGNGTFYWVLSSRGYSSSAAGSVQWGVAAAGDTPSLADMDGDGKADPVVWRPSTSEWFWLKSSVGYSPSRAGYVNMAPR